ncbi:hypothetical protein BESB_032500 [Besnoitia besnoiti]|uniref:Protein LTV1 homolog n=1 Tax=Besnoitia besnoiti TaxID=94643 RepID=A0A2A9M5X6_BESBE|nr:uncharacterized protein BESB_032500 [Besnoitia besnoiti]PFH31053.1 hypothetical protein BESB_032500 [Besnoitia besnoiti]
MREQLHEGGEDDDEEDEEASDVFPALSSEKVEAVRPVTGAQQRELEKKFDRVFEEYNDEFIGELDAEEVEDDQDKLLMSELEDAMEEFLQDQARRRKVCVDSTSRKYRQRHPEEKKRDDSSDEQEAHRRVESEDDEKEDSNEIREIFKPLDSAEISRIQELAARQQAEDEEAEKDGGKKRQEFDFLDLNDYEKRAGERRWDCETVLTTKSVSSFVPTKIALPPTHILKHQVRQLREGKGANLQTLGLPRRDAPKPENTAEASLASGLSPLREGDGSEEEGAQAADDFVDLPHEGLNEACIVTLRPKGETPEERRERKKAVKEAQRMVRVVKKQNKQLRKEEEKKMAARNAKSNAYDVKDGVRRVRL